MEMLTYSDIWSMGSLAMFVGDVGSLEMFGGGVFSGGVFSGDSFHKD